MHICSSVRADLMFSELELAIIKIFGKCVQASYTNQVQPTTATQFENMRFI